MTVPSKAIVAQSRSGQNNLHVLVSTFLQSFLVFIDN
jgi:hypothetical protein